MTSSSKRGDVARGLAADTPNPKAKQQHPSLSAEPQPDLEAVPNHLLFESAAKFHHPDPDEAPLVPLGSNPDNLPMRGDAAPDHSAAHPQTTYGVAKDELEAGSSPARSAARHPGQTAGSGEPNHPTAAQRARGAK